MWKVTALIIGFLFTIFPVCSSASQDTTPPHDLFLSFGEQTLASTGRTVVFGGADESGVVRFELKVIPLDQRVQIEQDLRYVARQVESPYLVPELPEGTYDLLLRAYDAEGNFNEVTQRMNIVHGPFGVTSWGEGVLESGYVGWSALLAMFFVISDILAILLLRSRKRFAFAKNLVRDGLDPSLEKIRALINEVSMRNKIPLATFACLIGVATLLIPGVGKANSFTAPEVTTYPRALSDTQFPYLGGVGADKNAQIYIEITTLQGDPIERVTITPDQRGFWFTQLDHQLRDDVVVVARQVKDGEFSVPSPQIVLEVDQTSLSVFGVPVSYLVLLRLLVLVMGLITLLLFLAYMVSVIRERHAFSVLRTHEFHAKKELEHQLVLLRSKLAERGAEREVRKISQTLLPDDVGADELLKTEIAELDRAILRVRNS